MISKQKIFFLISLAFFQIFYRDYEKISVNRILL